MVLCQVKVFHKKKQAERAKANIPGPVTLKRMIDIFEALSDPRRLKIVAANT